MELILTVKREAAIVKEYGSTDYIQSYVDALAEHLIKKQADDDKTSKIEALAGLSKDKISDDYAKAKEKVKAELIKDGEVTPVVKPVKEG